MVIMMIIVLVMVVILMLLKVMMMKMMMMVMMMMMLAHGWRLPRGGKRAQRDSALKLIVIHFAKIQNWGRC